MDVRAEVAAALTKPFGAVLADRMILTEYRDQQWSPPRVMPSHTLPLSPGAHALHYGSACFEGLKAHRWDDGSLHIFRLADHIERLVHSADLVGLPVPDPATVEAMILEIVAACSEWAPTFPGSLYIRPTLIGNEPSIGKASAPSSTALFYVLLSPVGDYFQGGARPLSILLEDGYHRTTPHFGATKAGANYVQALGLTMRARKQWGVDQVVFAPRGDVQETGAANFLLLCPDRLLTRHLDATFLHGVTRDSLLHIARDAGLEVEERAISPAEVVEWVKDGEAALSGTAAVLAGVGTLVYQGTRHQVGTGQIGATTTRLRQALVSIQRGQAEDRYGWLRRVPG